METTSPPAIRRSTRRKLHVPSPTHTIAPASTDGSHRPPAGLGRGKSIHLTPQGHPSTSILRPVTSTPALSSSERERRKASMGRRPASALREPGTLLPTAERRHSESLKRKTSRSSKSKRRDFSVGYDKVDEPLEDDHQDGILSSQMSPPTTKRSHLSDRRLEHVQHTGGKITSGWAPKPCLEHYANRYTSSIRSTLGWHQQNVPESPIMGYNPEDGLIDVTRDESGVHHVPQPSDGGVRKAYYSYSRSPPTKTSTRSLSTLSLGDPGDVGEGWGSELGGMRRNISFVGSEYLGDEGREEFESEPLRVTEDGPELWTPAIAAHQAHLARTKSVGRHPPISIHQQTCINPALIFKR